jgi:hypothetical protein
MSNCFKLKRAPDDLGIMITRKTQKRRQRTKLVLEFWLMIEKSSPIRIKTERYNKDRIKNKKKFNIRADPTTLIGMATRRIRLMINPSNKGNDTDKNAAEYFAKIKLALLKEFEKTRRNVLFSLSEDTALNVRTSAKKPRRN